MPVVAPTSWFPPEEVVKWGYGAPISRVFFTPYKAHLLSAIYKVKGVVITPFIPGRGSPCIQQNVFFLHPMGHVNQPPTACEISSRAEVASSRISSRGFFTMARATAKRCFSPPLKSLPLSPTSVCQRLGKASALKKVSFNQSASEN